MGHRNTDPLDLTPVLKRFPDAAAEVRRLWLRDPRFRGLCEDYCLAAVTLARFERLPDAATRPEIAEYRSIIADLGAEIEASLRGAARSRS